MKILKAIYGNIECTKEVQAKVFNDSLVIRADNNIIGDPLVGTPKLLQVWGEGFYQEAKEGGLITYPASKNDRLGIFYSNNINPKLDATIRKSIDTIQIAAQDKADIVTCVWNHIPDNPFYELISWNRSSSHLNQLLQIMQCLYSAKELGTYKYVSFLEHDVLYPKGYFDFPDFAKGNVLTNMNYGGVNANGWQRRDRNDEPFHQMTMHFEDAIRHCEAILPNALVTNSGMIETQTLNRIQWMCENEAIHMNHGYHFTSHNSIYRQSGTYAMHEYWGNYTDIIKLFPN